MFEKSELSKRLVSELKEIAETLGVNNLEKMKKNEMVEAILQKVPVTSEVVEDKKASKPKKKSPYLTILRTHGHKLNSTLRIS